jgi:hypothetical protein
MGATGTVQADLTIDRLASGGTTGEQVRGFFGVVVGPVGIEPTTKGL